MTEIAHLICEYRTNPLGIDVSTRVWAGRCRPIAREHGKPPIKFCRRQRSTN